MQAGVFIACYDLPMGTHWDDIYKNYEQGGVAWATLSEDIHPLLISFLDEMVFPKKHALDIGCGTGKYLHYLDGKEFAVDGIDSSDMAVKMTQDLVPASKVILADMYSCAIAPDTYDLIVSVSTIHHGAKSQVASVVQKIHEGLVEGGHVFITIPSWNSQREEKMQSDHTTIAPGTLAPLTGPEAGLAHSFYTEHEVRDLFKNFHNREMQLDVYDRWVVTGTR